MKSMVKILQKRFDIKKKKSGIMLVAKIIEKQPEHYKSGKWKIRRFPRKKIVDRPSAAGSPLLYPSSVDEKLFSVILIMGDL